MLAMNNNYPQPRPFNYGLLTKELIDTDHMIKELLILKPSYDIMSLQYRNTIPFPTWRRKWTRKILMN